MDCRGININPTSDALIKTRQFAAAADKHAVCVSTHNNSLKRLQHERRQVGTSSIGSRIHCSLLLFGFNSLQMESVCCLCECVSAGQLIEQ